GVRRRTPGLSRRENASILHAARLAACLAGSPTARQEATRRLTPSMDTQRHISASLLPPFVSSWRRFDADHVALAKRLPLEVAEREGHRICERVENCHLVFVRLGLASCDSRRILAGQPPREVAGLDARRLEADFVDDPRQHDESRVADDCEG